MTLLVVRVKLGAYVPSDPENKDSVLKGVGAGVVTLVPESFDLPKEKYDLISKVEIKKNNQKT